MTQGSLGDGGVLRRRALLCTIPSAAIPYNTQPLAPVPHMIIIKSALLLFQQQDHSSRESEVKLWTPLRGGLPVGVGRADTGGNPGSVGDKFAFGNTEERARLANMGCKQRGFRWSTGVRPHHRPRLRQVAAWPLP